jgi:hypothetical protein
MLKKLKRRSIKKKTDKNLLKRDLSQVNAPLKTLGFLIDEDSFQDFEKLYDYSKYLGLQRKDIKVFSFIEFKKKAPSLRQDQITNKDFSWDGLINNQSAKEFLTKDFDVLVGYYNGTHEFLDLMVSESKAKFKVGSAGADKRLFDLLIGINPLETEIFKTELKKYLIILNKIQ